MVRYVVAAAMVLTFLLAVGGCAKKKGIASMDEVYVKYDANKDGVITREEFMTKWRDKQKAEAAWKQVDTKNNGFVDRVINNDAPLDVWRSVESNSDPW